nr:juvenile hormone epoxide hydrolase [Helicoverpa armigera]
MASFQKVFAIFVIISGSCHAEDLVSYDEWWGPEGSSTENDTSIRPFTVQFDEDIITDLKYRLSHHRNFTSPLNDSAFTYGFNSDALQSWLTYWSDTYNFTERETYLNQFPQYKSNVQGLDIHFIRVTPEVPSGVEVVPLLLLHGWPGSVREFFKAIPLLTAVADDRDFAVEVIAPSLPGFGFSDAATRPGLGSSEMAVILRNFMFRLGYSKFYVQGGDWGAYIATDMCTLFPKEVIGFHTNLALSLSPVSLGVWALGSILPSAVVDSSVQDRMYPLLNIVEGLLRELGYLHLQTTKPDTVGIAMSDSPAGLLAYILQLFSMATTRDNNNKADGGLTDTFSREELLDNLMIYWMTNSFTTSARLYSETFNIRNVKMGIYAMPTSVPMWSVHAKNELVYQSPTVLKFKFTNHVHATILDEFGHFLALQAPGVFAEDVLKAITAFRNCSINNICIRAS